MAYFVTLKIFVNLALVVICNNSLRGKLDVFLNEGISKLLWNKHWAFPHTFEATVVFSCFFASHVWDLQMMYWEWIKLEELWPMR